MFAKTLFSRAFEPERSSVRLVKVNESADRRQKASRYSAAIARGAPSVAEHSRSVSEARAIGFVR